MKKHMRDKTNKRYVKGIDVSKVFYVSISHSNHIKALKEKNTAIEFERNAQSIEEEKKDNLKYLEDDDGEVRLLRFKNYLRRQEYFDIVSQQVKFLYDKTEPGPPSGQPAVVSNQGNAPTCSSHAVGKCIVDIIDSYGLNCDQEAVIKALIKEVQPDQKAEYIHRFNKRSIDVNVWAKDGTKAKIKISLLVQPNDYASISRMTQEWFKNGPKMTKKEMLKYNKRMVGCWIGSHQQPFKHAVYIKEWTQVDGTKNKYNFDCINSWGEGPLKQPTPQLGEKDFSNVYYVSLYAETDKNLKNKNSCLLCFPIRRN